MKQPNHLNVFTFHITLYDLAFLAIIFVGLTISLQLWFTNKINRAANRFLSLALAIIVLWIVWLLCIDIRLDVYFPRWDWLPLRYSLALGPLIYFYVLKTTRPEYKFHPKNLLHFHPLLMEQSVLVLQVKESIKTGAATYHTLIFHQLSLIMHLAAFISVSAYMYGAFRLIKQFYQRLKFNNASDRYRYELRWLYRLLAGFGVVWLLWIPLTAVDYLYYHGQMDIRTYYPLYLLLAVIFVRIAIVSFLRPDNIVPVHAPLVSKPLLPAEVKQKGTWLKKVVKENGYYLDPDLSLPLLAEKLKMPIHELSRIINIALKKSFNDFINEYRVAEVTRKMQDPANDHITLLGIAFESGFNSRTTFHRIFKQITGNSPAQYKTGRKKEIPSYNLESYSGVASVISYQQTTPRWSSEKLNRNFMFRNYLKMAWRNLINHKAYTLLNVIGLATGMGIALIIGLWVFYQYSYDRFLPGYEQVYKVAVKYTVNGETGINDITAIPLGEVIKKDIPGIQYMAQTSMWRHGLMYEDKKVYLNGGMVGSDFLRILKYPLMAGNAGEALKDPYSIILTESTAHSLFGNINPIGKTVRIDNKNNLKVTGILKEVPPNATIQFNYLIPFDYFIQSDDNIKRAVTDWSHVTFKTYIALAPHVSYAQVAPLLKKMIAKYNPADYRSVKSEPVLLPLKDWHLYSEFKNGVASGGLIDYVKMFGFIGILVLVIACINFTNLSTARSEKRAKEVGVRKVIGSSKKDLIFQFLVESVLITFIAGIISLFIVQIALPSFNQIVKADIHIPFFSPLFWSLMIGYILFTGLMAGSRPAFYLSSFRPVKVLKGSIQTGKAAALPRKALVVLQFTCSIALIIGTIIIYQQIRHAQDRDLGYKTNRLVMTDFNKDLNRNYKALKQELLQSGAVVSVTKSNSPVTDIWSEGGVTNWPGKTSSGDLHVGFIGVTDADYFKTMGMEIIGEGGFFSNPVTDSNTAVLNQAAVEEMQLKSPMNQLIDWDGRKLKVVGVVKNALMTSPFGSAMPSLFIYDPNWSNIVTYKLSPNMGTSEAITRIGKIFNKYSPAVPYTYKFVDESYNQKFDFEMLVGKLAGIFAAFAILISCLGLFGLAAYMAEQRNKEIGIRKVLGATVTQVWMLLSKEFVMLVVISSVIASPLAFYFLHNWLQKYDYRIDIDPLIFIAAGAGAIVITVVTVSFQSVKAALANPSKSLKAE